MQRATVQKFADKNTLTNSDKFKVFVIDNKEQTTQIERFKLATKILLLSVKFSGITIDDHLTQLTFTCSKSTRETLETM